VVGGPQFERWCRLTGGESFFDDARFKDDISRGDHGKILSAHMTLWCANRTTDEVLSALEEAKLPAGPVYSPQQALDDAHVQAIGFMQQVGYAGTFAGTLETSPVADYPVSLSATPGTIRKGAPQLGEHTDEILLELGYAAADIQRMRDTRVV
jgi:crotonobetainyl-CoA:carnitine CoA-transferase CaiB-like acyl-CoA transferase